MTIFENSRFRSASGAYSARSAKLTKAPKLALRREEKPYVTASELHKQKEADDAPLSSLLPPSGEAEMEAVSKFIKHMRTQKHGARFNDLAISKQRKLASVYLNFVSVVSEYEARNFIDRKDLIGLNFMAERAVFQGNLSELEGLMEYIIEKVEGCKSSLGIN